MTRPKNTGHTTVKGKQFRFFMKDKVGFEPTVLINTLVFKTNTLNRSVIYPKKA